MGQVIPFPRPQGATRVAALANSLVATNAALPQLLSVMGDVGRSTEALCRSFQDSLLQLSASFDEALMLNAAHRRLQRATQDAMELAATDPEKAALRLAELRADYARINCQGS
ncbi:hypothetical protein [Niveispirillum fermenti]|uniref:hypothetical protein n=1 Tax=Niveispirillum fermenti TaxID=1233113 RepID=UPI003A857977